MVLKTYRRRGEFLQGKQIEMPTPEKKAPNIWGKMLDDVSKVTAKLSEQNYALGRAELINGVLETAYNEAPDNPKRFDELIKSGFENGLNGLSEETKNDIYSLANDKVKTLQIKVGNNLNKKLDAENTQKILNLTNEALYGTNGIQQTESLIAEYITTGKNASGKEVSKEEMDALLDQRNKQIARLKALGQAKNLRGNYVIGDRALRKAIETSNYGMNDLLLDNISLMSYDTLKEFDENIFQDRKAFMDRTGLDVKSYTAMDNKIKKRRKELNEDDERVQNDEFMFNTVAAIYQKNPQILEDAKERLNPDMYKKVEKLIMQPTNKKEMMVTNEDADLLRQFNSVLELADMKYTGNKNYNENYMAKLVDAGVFLDKYRSTYGSSDKNDTITDNMLYTVASENMFSDALGTIDNTSAFGYIVRNARIPDAPDAKKTDIAGYMKESMKREVALATLPVDPTPELTYEEEQHIAAEAAKVVDVLGNQLKATQDPEARQAIQDQIIQTFDDANTNIIKVKMRPLISDKDFDRCLSESKSGKDSYFVNKKNGLTYKFLGLTNNGVAIK